MTPSKSETKWLEKFNAIMYELKSYHPPPYHRWYYEFHKRLLQHVVTFESEARSLNLKEEDFDMSPLPFERVCGGLLPKKHLNPFEAAEHYREVVDDFVVERRNTEEARERRKVTGWWAITDEDISEVCEIAAGVAKAKQEGLWPPERMPRRRQVVSLEDYYGF